VDRLVSECPSAARIELLGHPAGTRRLARFAVSLAVSAGVMNASRKGWLSTMRQQGSFCRFDDSSTTSWSAAAEFPFLAGSSFTCSRFHAQRRRSASIDFYPAGTLGAGTRTVCSQRSPATGAVTRGSSHFPQGTVAVADDPGPTGSPLFGYLTRLSWLGRFRPDTG